MTSDHVRARLFGAVTRPLQAFLRLEAASGILLLLCAIAALVALLSYHSDDASLNNANGRAVANLMGPFGAVAADLLLQTFGFAAVHGIRVDGDRLDGGADPGHDGIAMRA